MLTDRECRAAKAGEKPVKGGRMFKRIEMARNMRVTPTADEVSLSFNSRVARTAEVHHFGLEDAVDRRIRNSIRVRYKARRLLGFGPGDREAMLAAVMA